jgi:hypothetical protein
VSEEWLSDTVSEQLELRFDGDRPLAGESARPLGFMPGAPLDCGPGMAGPEREYVCVFATRELDRATLRGMTGAR